MGKSIKIFMPEILPRAHDKKICIRCSELKNFSEFHKHSKSKGGIDARCKICVNEFYLIKRRNKNINKVQYDNRPLGRKLSEEEFIELKSKNKAFVIYTSDIVKSLWPFSYLDFTTAVPARIPSGFYIRDNGKGINDKQKYSNDDSINEIIKNMKWYEYLKMAESDRQHKKNQLVRKKAYYWENVEYSRKKARKRYHKNKLEEK